MISKGSWVALAFLGKVSEKVRECNRVGGKC